MSDRYFLDTNVLVYADDRDAGAKRDRAREILREAIATRRGVISTQVLKEFFVVSTRKLGVGARSARRKIELLGALDVVVVDQERILGAVDLHILHALSFWDALIVRCAAVARCARLLTEDMGHGTVIEGVRIENPFRGL